MRNPEVYTAGTARARAVSMVEWRDALPKVVKGDQILQMNADAFRRLLTTTESLLVTVAKQQDEITWLRDRLDKTT